jgi:cystathionine beta-lyase family protein involved in aluminum resistance
MEILLAIVVVAVVGALIYFNRKNKSFDINNDGKIDAADIKAAVQNAVTGVQASADVNKDGKVDAADVKVVAETVKTQVKKAVVKAAAKPKAAVKKAANRGRKAK